MAAQQYNSFVELQKGIDEQAKKGLQVSHLSTCCINELGDIVYTALFEKTQQRKEMEINWPAR